MKILSLFVVFLLISCSSQKDIEEGLNKAIGQTEDALISVLGPPSSVHETKELRYITYSTSSERMSRPYYEPVTGYLQMPQKRISSCDTTFTIKEGKVTNWRYSGNACY